MKKIICIIWFLLGILLLNAQELSSSMKETIKTDDVQAFIKSTENNDINTCYELGKGRYNILALSIKYNANNIFNYLIEKSDLESICGDKTALMYAVKYGEIEKVKRLISFGVDTTRVNNNKTALDYAQKYDQVEIYRYLKSL